MDIINIAAAKQGKREKRKAEVLAAVERELNRVHESNFYIAAQKIIEYAELQGSVGAIPGRSRQIEENVRRLMEESRKERQ